MKKCIVFIVSVIFCITLAAQNDVTKFLGFPIDGNKYDMVKNLKSKGFKVKSSGSVEYLSGKFNGTNVNVYIVTDKGNVSRIMVSDEYPTSSETEIKARFNRLCRQFEGNGKYYYVEDQTIPDDEDISYQMTVKDKRYEAVFYQIPEGKDFEELRGEIFDECISKYDLEDLKNASGEIDEVKKELIATECVQSLREYLAKRPVWFMISREYGKYYISMFYDNEYNRAQGEDL